MKAISLGNVLMLNNQGISTDKQ